MIDIGFVVVEDDTKDLWTMKNSDEEGTNPNEEEIT